MYANSWTWQNVWSGLWHSNCFNALQVWQCQEISWLKTRVTGSSEALHRKGWCISNWKDSQSGRSSLSSAPWRGRCQKTRSGGPGAWVRKTIIGFNIIVVDPPVAVAVTSITSLLFPKLVTIRPPFATSKWSPVVNLERSSHLSLFDIFAQFEAGG